MAIPRFLDLVVTRPVCIMLVRILVTHESHGRRLHLRSLTTLYDNPAVKDMVAI